MVFDRKSKTCSELCRRIENLQPEADPPQAEKWLGLLVIAFVLVVTGAVVDAQQPARIPRIGFLTGGSPTDVAEVTQTLAECLVAGRISEGKNIVIEWRLWDGRQDHQRALAAELVRLNVDVIVAVGSGDIRAAKEASPTIPIVMVSGGDAVGSGFGASLARPGGNLTGLSSYSAELNGKRLELLKEIVPRLSRVAVVGESIYPGNAQSFREVELAAAAFGVRLLYVDVLSPRDTETAFLAAGNGHAEAILALHSAVLNSRRKQIADLAIKSRLPAIYYAAEWMEAGGLMSYATSITDLYRRAATYVDKILEGAKPADLPAEQPKKFELTVNLKAAKQIGLTIPPNVLARADKVIR